MHQVPEGISLSGISLSGIKLGLIQSQFNASNDGIFFLFILIHYSRIHPKLTFLWIDRRNTSAMFKNLFLKMSQGSSTFLSFQFFSLLNLVHQVFHWLICSVIVRIRLLCHPCNRAYQTTNKRNNSGLIAVGSLMMLSSIFINEYY